VGFIDAAMKHAIAGETIEIWGDGNVVRDYIYIDDVCRMLYALMDYHGDQEVFNISSNTGTSQNDIVRILQRKFPQVEVVYKPGRSVDAKRIILDNRRIRSICDGSMVSLEDGIHKYYDYIISQRK
jgi:UDP-glucose 4-epimerase